MTTVTTVGYGDTFPVTAGGRGIAVVLMLLGISIFGVLAASLAAYFVEQDASSETGNRLTDIQLRLGRIEQGLRDMRDRESNDHPIGDPLGQGSRLPARAEDRSTDLVGAGRP